MVFPRRCFSIPAQWGRLTLRYECKVFMPDWCPNLCQVVVPPDVLDEAEAKWAPPDDPVFQLVPLDFEYYVTRCFEDLGKPEVNFDTFWDVYHGLRDLVEVTVPGNIAATLNENTGDDSDGIVELPAHAYLKELDFVADDGESDGGDGEDDEIGFPFVDFTNEEGRDELS